jgi:hypothetical protein
VQEADGNASVNVGAESARKDTLHEGHKPTLDVLAADDAYAEGRNKPQGQREFQKNHNTTRT